MEDGMKIICLFFWGNYCAVLCSMILLLLCVGVCCAALCLNWMAERGSVKIFMVKEDRRWRL
jgi:hypothetical protein